MMSDYERISALLTYDSEQGLLVWRRRSESYFKSRTGCLIWNKRFADTVAGHPAKGCRTFYSRVSISGKKYLAHRICWLLYYGKWPDCCIDHIDGNGLNNKIDNLRDTTHAENSKRKRVRVDNKTGKTGVIFNKSLRKWTANIQATGRREFLGAFDSFEAACVARDTAENRKGFTVIEGGLSQSSINEMMSEPEGAA